MTPLLFSAVALQQPGYSTGYDFLSPPFILAYIVIGGIIYYLIYRRYKK